MKKIKNNKKLSLNKKTVANLDTIIGGNVPLPSGQTMCSMFECPEPPTRGWFCGSIQIGPVNICA